MQTFGALSPPKRTVFIAGLSKSVSLRERLQIYFDQHSDSTFKAPLNIEWLIRFGAVYVNRNRVMDPLSVVHLQDTVRVHVEPKRYRIGLGKSSVIFAETENFFIINKPSGLPIHATL